MHYKNNLIDLDWEVYNDLIEQKLLYAQYYAHEVWFWTFQMKWSRNTNVLFERKIIITEYFTDSSRFDLEFKTNMKFLVNWWVSIISELHNLCYLHENLHAEWQLLYWSKITWALSKTEIAETLATSRWSSAPGATWPTSFIYNELNDTPRNVCSSNRSLTRSR